MRPTVRVRELAVAPFVGVSAVGCACARPARSLRAIECVARAAHARVSCVHAHVRVRSLGCVRECGHLCAFPDTCAGKERACAHDCVRSRPTMQNLIFITESGLDFQPEKWDQFWARKLGYANDQRCARQPV